MSIAHPTPLSPSTPVPASSADLPPLPDEVRAFCDRQAIRDYVAVTVRMLREAFPPPGDIAVSLFTDPESDDERPISWVVVRIHAAGTTAALLQAYERFLDRWVPATPAPVRELITGSFSPV